MAFQIRAGTILVRILPCPWARSASAQLPAAQIQDACLSCEAANCAPGACGDFVGCSLCPYGFGTTAARAPFTCDFACPSNCADCDQPYAQGGGACARCREVHLTWFRHKTVCWITSLNTHC